MTFASINSAIRVLDSPSAASDTIRARFAAEVRSVRRREPSCLSTRKSHHVDLIRAVGDP
jgi:hypothetical protein